MTEQATREREALLDWLVAQRGHVLGVLSGLSEEDLRQPETSAVFRDEPSL